MGVSEGYKQRLSAWISAELATMGTRTLSRHFEEKTGIPISHSSLGNWSRGKLSRGLSYEAMKAIAIYRGWPDSQAVSTWLTTGVLPEEVGKKVVRHARTAALMEHAVDEEMTSRLEILQRQVLGIQSEIADLVALIRKRGRGVSRMNVKGMVLRAFAERGKRVDVDADWQEFADVGMMDSERLARIRDCLLTDKCISFIDEPFVLQNYCAYTGEFIDHQAEENPHDHHDHEGCHHSVA